MSLKSRIRRLFGGARKRDTITHFTGKPTSRPKTPKPMRTVFEPATPNRAYICQNCGMLIETGHKHTRGECQSYQENPVNPDLRAHRTILPARNDPKICLPYYYEERKI